MDEPGATAAMAVKNRSYHHGHSGPDDDARLNGLRSTEELMLKNLGRRRGNLPESRLQLNGEHNCNRT